MTVAELTTMVPFSITVHAPSGDADVWLLARPRYAHPVAAAVMRAGVEVHCHSRRRHRVTMRPRDIV